MRVGAAVIFQGVHGQLEDRRVYREEVALADEFEPLGFESIWAVEHHFTDYTILPDPIQFLTYMAGRTKTVELGTMVVVLPWHDPVRLAEQVAMVDHLSDGRFVLGIGRGLGRVEFEGFRIPMEESRDRFRESAELLLDGLERGYVEYDGTFFQQPKRDLRPGPTRSFKGRTFAAAISPESSQTVAELGVGVLVVPQKPWDTVFADMRTYRDAYRVAQSCEAPPAVVSAWVFCDENEDRARQMAHRYIGHYYESVVEHYELGGHHFRQTAGYAYYDRMAKHLQRDGTDEAVKFFVDLQVWGTPEQCAEKIEWICCEVRAETFVGVFQYGGMPTAEGHRNARLFAAEVAPRLRGATVSPVASKEADVPGPLRPHARASRAEVRGEDLS